MVVSGGGIDGRPAGGVRCRELFGDTAPLSFLSRPRLLLLFPFSGDPSFDLAACRELFIIRKSPTPPPGVVAPPPDGDR